MSSASQRVLIVDDDPAIRDPLVSALGKRELTVDQATDERQALDLLEKNTYAVVLLDGLAAIRGLDSATSAPVVLVITAIERSKLPRFDPRKIHGIIRKPFDAEQLADLVVACAEIKSRSVQPSVA